MNLSLLKQEILPALHRILLFLEKGRKNDMPNRLDGFVKSPTSALRCILRHCSVLYVPFVPQDLRALNLELFTLLSDFDFLRDYQTLSH